MSWTRKGKSTAAGSAEILFPSLESALKPEAIGYVGSAMWLAWATRSDWIHRRVDSVEFMDAETMRVHASIDFTVPEGMPVIGDQIAGRSRVMVPLTVLRKDEPVFHFDLLDEAGGTISKLRAQDAAAVGGEILVSLVRVKRPTDPRPLLEEGLRGIALSEPSGVERIHPADALSMHTAALFGGSPPLTDAINLVAENYLLCALVAGRAGESHIVKIQYDLHHEEELPFLGSARRKLGWLPWLFTVPVTAPAVKTYHCEITVPDGVVIHKAVRIDVEKNENGEETRKEVTDGIVIREAVTQMTFNHVPSDYKGFFEVGLRAARRGWLWEALASGTVIVAMMWFVVCAASRLTHPDDAKEHPATDVVFLVGTVLLALAAALIALLARNDEHRLRSEMLAYCRGIYSAIVALTFMGVLVLVGARSSGVVRDWFRGFTALSVVCVVLVGIAWKASKPPRRPPS